MNKLYKIYRYSKFHLFQCFLTKNIFSILCSYRSTIEIAKYQYLWLFTMTSPECVPDALDGYEKLSKLGSGSYGSVYQYRCIATNRLVAIKTLFFDQNEEGLSKHTLRELSILKQVKHPALIEAKDIIIRGKKIYFVYDYYRYNLGVLFARKSLDPRLVKTYSFQILSGLNYLHANSIMHRDLKLDNILIDRDGHLKIIDFGLSRYFTLPLKRYTGELCTFCFQPPEIAVGSGFYDPGIDIWAAGCIITALVNRRYLFSADSQIELIHKMLDVFGRPSDEMCSVYPGLQKVDLSKYEIIDEPHLIDTDDLYLKDLILQMLCFDFRKRITAKDALIHPYFDSIPDWMRDAYA